MLNIIQFFLNKKNGDNKWDATGKVAVKDENGNVIFISNSDPKYISKKYTHINSGYDMFFDEYKKVIRTRVDSAYSESGKYIPVFKGKIPVKDKDGNTFSVKRDDPRYISGELTPILKGKVIVKDENGNIFSINKNDSRYETGELVSCQKGTFLVKDKFGNMLRTTKSDPKFISGEYIALNKGTVTCYDIVLKQYVVVSKEEYHLHKKVKYITARTKTKYYS